MEEQGCLKLFSCPLPLAGTNSPTGIGRASAHQFARNGAKAVFVCDVADSYLSVHKREMETLYPNVDIHIRQFDVGDESQTKAIVDEALAKYGRLDIMFANAGVSGQVKLFNETTGDEFMSTLTTNVKGYESSPTISLIIKFSEGYGSRSENE